VVQTDYYYSDSASPVVRCTHYVYDAAGRLISVREDVHGTHPWLREGQPPPHGG
jgi:hypothetical protein